MALVINGKETPVSENIASERLYLNADKTKVVHEGDPEARFLLAGEGGEIPDEYVDLAPKAKKAKPAEDKAVDAPANKKA